MLDQQWMWANSCLPRVPRGTGTCTGTYKIARVDGLPVETISKYGFMFMCSHTQPKRRKVVRRAWNWVPIFGKTYAIISSFSYASIPFKCTTCLVNIGSMEINRMQFLRQMPAFTETKTHQSKSSLATSTVSLWCRYVANCCECPNA